MCQIFRMKGYEIFAREIHRKQDGFDIWLPEAVFTMLCFLILPHLTILRSKPRDQTLWYFIIFDME